MIAHVIDWVNRGWPWGPFGQELQPYALRKLELSVQNGCLLWGHRMIVPPPLWRSMLATLHQGHPGIVRMKALERCYMWWPHLDKDVTEWVSTCQKCQGSRPLPPKDHPREWEELRAPWSCVHLDFTGPSKDRYS